MRVFFILYFFLMQSYDFFMDRPKIRVRILFAMTFSGSKVTKKGVKNNSAKPENRSPRVRL